MPKSKKPRPGKRRGARGRKFLSYKILLVPGEVLTAIYPEIGVQVRMVTVEVKGTRAPEDPRPHMKFVDADEKTKRLHRVDK